MQSVKSRDVVRVFCIMLAVIVMLSMCARVDKVHAAGKKTVYVVSKTYTDAKSKNNVYEKVSYNSKGLMKKISYGVKGSVYWKYKYDKKNRVALKAQFINDWTNFKYTYKKGKLVKVAGYYSEKFGGKKKLSGCTSTFKYNSKRLIKSEKVSGVRIDENKKTSFTIKYAYDKKGHVKRMYHPYPDNVTTHYYTYDKKGNLVKEVTKFKEGNEVEEVTYENTYKNGRLVKQVETYDTGESFTKFFSYKKISVPKKLVKKVKTQQWSFLNRDLNNAEPIKNYGGM